MKKYLVILFLSGICCHASAQLMFQKVYNLNYDVGYSIEQTADSGYIVAGLGTAPNGNVYPDISINKVTVTGDTMWRKTFGNVGTQDECHSAIQTIDGGYILTGKRPIIPGDWDACLIKTDANGDTLWTKTFGGSGAGFEEGIKIIQTADSDYLILGGTTLFGPGQYNIWLIKTNANGDMLWSKTYGGLVVNGGNALRQTMDGGYIIAGITNSFSGNFDAYLIKTDAAGNVSWSKTYGGADEDRAYDVDQTNDGGYIISGSTFLPTDYYEAYAIKTDSLGNTVWAKTYGSFEYETFYSGRQTTDGGFVFAGYEDSNGGNSVNAYIVKTDGNGDTLWTHLYGGIGGYSLAWCVRQTFDGGYILCGSTDQLATSNGGLYLIKTDANGNSGCYQNASITNVASFPSPAITVTTLVATASPASLVPVVTLGSDGPTVITGCTAVGIKEEENTIGFLTAPNPTHSDFVIMFSEAVKHGKIEVVNVMGAVVFSEVVTNVLKKEMQLKNIPAGIYFIKLLSGGKQYTQKLIVERD